jgi:hypothetical protein
MRGSEKKNTLPGYHARIVGQNEPRTEGTPGVPSVRGSYQAVAYQTHALWMIVILITRAAAPHPQWMKQYES